MRYVLYIPETNNPNDECCLEKFDTFDLAEEFCLKEIPWTWHVIFNEGHIQSLKKLLASKP